MRRTTEPNSKTPTHHFPYFYFYFMAKPGAQGRESLFTGAGRRNDDTRMMLSTAVTSPEVEEHGAKMTSRFWPRARNRPALPHLPGRHSSVWGTKCLIIKRENRFCGPTRPENMFSKGPVKGPSRRGRAYFTIIIISSTVTTTIYSHRHHYHHT